MKVIRGIRRKQLLVNLKKTRRHWKLKEQELDSILWKTRIGRYYWPFERQDYVTNLFRVHKTTRCTYRSYWTKDLKLWEKTANSDSCVVSFLHSQSNLSLPNHFRCRGLLLHVVTHKDTLKLGRTPLDQRSAHRNNNNIKSATTSNSHKGQTSTFLAVFEPAIPESKQPQA